MRLLMPTILNPSGISRASREVFKLIRHMGLKVSTLLTLDEELHLLEEEVVDSMTEASAPFNRQEGFIQLHVGPPNNMSVLKSARAVIGFFVMEGQRLSPMQVEPCRRASLCLVPSNFCHRACLASGVPRSRVRIVPYPLDTSRWHPGVQPISPPGGRFRFLYMNSIYERKGLDVLLRAWWEEFGPGDPVVLVIKSYRENDRPEPASVFMQEVAQRALVDPGQRAPIVIADEPIRDDDLPGFVRSFDAVVSTHRSEGFGMTPWYAMALGVPVICTDYGGTTDFATEDTAWLVDVEGMSCPSRKEIDIFGHLDGITWAEPSVRSAREQMRACFAQERERRERSKAGSSLLAERYNFDAVGRSFEEALRMLPCGSSALKDRVPPVRVPPRFDGENPAEMIEISRK